MNHQEIAQKLVEDLDPLSMGTDQGRITEISGYLEEEDNPTTESAYYHIMFFVDAKGKEKMEILHTTDQADLILKKILDIDKNVSNVEINC